MCCLIHLSISHLFQFLFLPSAFPAISPNLPCLPPPQVQPPSLFTLPPSLLFPFTLHPSLIPFFLLPCTLMYVLKVFSLFLRHPSLQSIAPFLRPSPKLSYRFAGISLNWLYSTSRNFGVFFFIISTFNHISRAFLSSWSLIQNQFVVLRRLVYFVYCSKLVGVCILAQGVCVRLWGEKAGGVCAPWYMPSPVPTWGATADQQSALNVQRREDLSQVSCDLRKFIAIDWIILLLFIRKVTDFSQV